MIKALLIDLDGTLVDSTPALYQAYLKFLVHYGHKGNRKEFDSLIGPSIDEIVHILKNTYQLPGSSRDLSMIYISTLMLQGFEGTKLFPGAKQALETAKKKNIKLGLVTSGTLSLVKACLKPFQINNDFDVIVTAEEVSQSKPHPEIYQVTLKKLGIQPENAIAVEDSPAGLSAAQGAGLPVIILTHGKAEQEMLDPKVTYLSSWADIDLWLQAQ